MDFLISANTDVGIKKDTNQDGLSVKVIGTPTGKIVFAILCDGMGGLAKGEVASTSVISAFNNWLSDKLPDLCRKGINDADVRKQWENILLTQNENIQAYGEKNGIKLGTTAVIMLLTNDRYYIMNIGDSRAYEIFDTVHQITEDQTFIHREIKMGRMTPEEAKIDPRRNVLLQCIGASEDIYPDMFFGDTKKNAVYMLCSDGFRHLITEDEIYQKFQPSALVDTNAMDKNSKELIELNKQRKENDNISVLLVRTY